jgi:hypothetical protein
MIRERLIKREYHGQVWYEVEIIDAKVSAPRRAQQAQPSSQRTPRHEGNDRQP